jgi:hypothetical protein
MKPLSIDEYFATAPHQESESLIQGRIQAYGYPSNGDNIYILLAGKSKHIQVHTRRDAKVLAALDKYNLEKPVEIEINNETHEIYSLNLRE